MTSTVRTWAPAAATASSIAGRMLRASLADIVRAIDATGTGITSMEVTEPNLEAVFLHLTGKALRDEG